MPDFDPARLRVLHVLDHSVPIHSGYSYRTLAILQAQRDAGYATFQLTGPKHGRTADANELAEGFEFWRTCPAPLRWLPLIGQVDAIRVLRERLRDVVLSVRPHLLHVHSPALNAVAALSVGRELGIPVVYEVRAFWEDAAVDHGTARAGGVRYRLGRALETSALRNAAAVVTISAGLRNEIVSTRGIAQDRITVVPNAVDLHRFPLLGASDPAAVRALGLEGKHVLAFVGSFYAYEGLDVLIDALRELPSRVHLLLVGGGPQDARLRARVRNLGLESRVIFMGQVPHDEVRHYYGIADLLVYPRRQMRLTELVTPLKPLEAMAQGRVVVASDVGGHRELITDGRTGVLFPAGDVRALARQVTRLLEEPDVCAKLRRAARTYVESERTWAASTARYGVAYRSALRSGCS
ncbi:MAG TPA: TIGR04063 family PEP-CTERM/XrtA system glycosyltransferase [Telluria sp.]|nr:TIGR04063 family PEP-CTERM/XrtA system glycosyltransferase [Telluria sp.]